MLSTQLGQGKLGQYQLGQTGNDSPPPPVFDPALSVPAELDFPNPVRLRTLKENLGFVEFVEISIPPNYGAAEAAFTSFTEYAAPKKTLKETLGFNVLLEFSDPIIPGLEGVESRSFTEYQPPKKKLKENLGFSELVEFSIPFQSAFDAAYISSTEYRPPRKSLRQPPGSVDMVRDFPRTVVNLLQPITCYPERTWRKPPQNPGFEVLVPMVIPNPLRQCELDTAVIPISPSSGVDPLLVGARIVAVIVYRGDPVC